MGKSGREDEGWDEEGGDCGSGEVGVSVYEAVSKNVQMEKKEKKGTYQ
jgi:hypothetical protein